MLTFGECSSTETRHVSTHFSGLVRAWKCPRPLSRSFSPGRPRHPRLEALLPRRTSQAPETTIAGLTRQMRICVQWSSRGLQQLNHLDIFMPISPSFHGHPRYSKLLARKFGSDYARKYRNLKALRSSQSGTVCYWFYKAHQPNHGPCQNKTPYSASYPSPPARLANFQAGFISGCEMLSVPLTGTS